MKWISNLLRRNSPQSSIETSKVEKTDSATVDPGAEGDQEPTQIRALPEEDLETIQKIAALAYDRVSDSEDGYLFRSAIIGSVHGTSMQLEVDDLSRNLWSSSSIAKARALLAVWTSTYLLWSFREDSALLSHVGSMGGFLSELFNLEYPDEMIGEMRLYISAVDADRTAEASGGIPVYTHSITYLRATKALGASGLSSLSKVPLPFTSMAALVEILDQPQPGVLGMDGSLVIAKVFLRVAETSREHFEILQRGQKNS